MHTELGCDNLIRRNSQNKKRNNRSAVMKMSRSLIWIAFVGGVILFSTWPGFGQSTRFYLTGGIGPAFTEDTNLKEFNGPVSPARVKFDPGFQFRVAGGYLITDWLATEL